MKIYQKNYEDFFLPYDIQLQLKMIYIISSITPDIFINETHKSKTSQ